MLEKWLAAGDRVVTMHLLCGDRSQVCCESRKVLHSRDLGRFRIALESAGHRRLRCEKPTLGRHHAAMRREALRAAPWKLAAPAVRPGRIARKGPACLRMGLRCGSSSQSGRDGRSPAAFYMVRMRWAPRERRGVRSAVHWLQAAPGRVHGRAWPARQGPHVRCPPSVLPCLVQAWQTQLL